MKKNKNFLLVDFNDQFFLDVGKKLINNGIKIPYIISDTESEYRKNSLFKSSKIFDPLIFFYPKYISKLNINNKESLSAEIIGKATEYENLFLTVSDRINFFPLSVRDRKQIYQQLLLYWYSFLKKNPVDAVVFASTPHLGFHNVIYGAAKLLNIKTIYLQRTLIENKLLLLCDYKKIDKIPGDYLGDKKKKELIELIREDFYKQIFIPSLWIKRSININQKAINQNPLFRIKEFLAVSFRFLKFLFKGQPTSVFYLNNGCNKLLIAFLCLVVNLKVNILRKYYQKNTSRVNWNKKFIFFSLHFQPERTTVPEGGVFENQLLAINILSKSVPKDWTIYVKEHPRQFETNDPRRRHYRSKDFYNEILMHKNVKLVKIEEDSEKMIDEAIFTVTVTGSSGWQSLLKNKPCLVFGNPWYSACNSCFVVESIEECKQAIDSILKKKSSDTEIDVLKFLAFYKNKFVTSTNAHYFASQSRLKYQDLVDNLANSLTKSVNR